MHDTFGRTLNTAWSTLLESLKTQIASLLILLSQPVFADGAGSFLDQICMRGFSKTTMPPDEATRFCSCVRGEVIPMLNQQQRNTLIAAQADMARGVAPSVERFASTGVKDLVIAGQARCEASFYPPSAPIHIKSGDFQLTLRCDYETKTPEAFMYRRGPMFSKAELQVRDARMMEGKLVSDYAKVTVVIDGGSAKTERWLFDISGEMISPPNSAQLIERLRHASTFSASIERGTNRFSEVFQVGGKIAARWMPCGGVTP
jgi:hypothetical protein